MLLYCHYWKSNRDNRLSEIIILVNSTIRAIKKYRDCSTFVFLYLRYFFAAKLFELVPTTAKWSAEITVRRLSHHPPCIFWYLLMQNIAFISATCKRYNGIYPRYLMLKEILKKSLLKKEKKKADGGVEVKNCWKQSTSE